MNKYNTNKINYWILLCNPLTWYEGTDLYQVNELLLNLDEEFWKINGKTVFNIIKPGDKGIIKVGKDRRTNKNRTNDKGFIENILEAGIYATFEVSYNKVENSFRKQQIGSSGKLESFVYIKIVDNFFEDHKIISKNDAIKLLGQQNFNTKSSKKITQKEYESILQKVEYNKTL